MRHAGMMVTLTRLRTRYRADKRKHRDNRDSHFNTSLWVGTWVLGVVLLSPL
jgi:hypothetical protein